MMGAATNIEEFKKFLVQVARAFRNPYAQVKPRLVMDNHPAHRSRHCRELLDQYFRPEFQPAYSKCSTQAKLARTWPWFEEPLLRSHLLTNSLFPVLGSPFNVVETCWAHLKREYFVRLHRRETNILDMAQFRAMIKALYEEVPLNQDSLLRANRQYVSFHAEIRLRGDSGDGSESY